MFTGIVEELAQIKTIVFKKKGMRYTIAAKTVIDDLEAGDSIAINGVCLTVINRTKDSFSMDLVEETLNKSNLGELKVGNYVNLERAMKVSDRLGGHIVQGHVETLGVILEKQIQNMEGRLNAVSKKLGNNNFVERAPENVINHERDKMNKYETGFGLNQLFRLQNPIPMKQYWWLKGH